MSFRVYDVTQTELNFDGYKVKINGTQYTLTKSSNDGQYETISVDTSVNKTVTVETTSGGTRAMINTITFYGESVIDTPVQPPVDSDSTGNSSTVDPEIPNDSSSNSSSSSGNSSSTGGNSSSNNNSGSSSSESSSTPSDTSNSENVGESTLDGCGGVISVGAVGLVGALTAAFIFLKKKEQ